MAKKTLEKLRTYDPYQPRAYETARQREDRERQEQQNEYRVRVEERRRRRGFRVEDTLF